MIVDIGPMSSKSSRLDNDLPSNTALSFRATSGGIIVSAHVTVFWRNVRCFEVIKAV